MLTQKQKIGLLARSIISLKCKADEMPNREGNRLLISELYEDVEQMKQWLAEMAQGEKTSAQKIAVEFFYWWHNQPGTNTQQGFEQWWEEVKQG